MRSHAFLRAVKKYGLRVLFIRELQEFVSISRCQCGRVEPVPFGGGTRSRLKQDVPACLTLIKIGGAGRPTYWPAHKSRDTVGRISSKQPRDAPFDSNNTLDVSEASPTPLQPLGGLSLAVSEHLIRNTPN